MWPFFLALKQLFPPRRFPVFAFISILGTAFGVAALLVVQTVMFSFGEEHRLCIRETYGDLTVEGYGQQPILDAVWAEDSLKKTAGVEAVSPYICGMSVYLPEIPERNFQTTPAFLLYGIDSDKAARVYPFERYEADRGKAAKQSENAGSPKRGSAGEVIREIDDDRIILGQVLADRLRVSAKEHISMLSGKRVQRLLNDAAGGDVNEVRLPKDVEVLATISTGYRPADAYIALTSLRSAREFFEMPEGAVSGFRLKLKDPSRAEQLAEELNQKMPHPLYAKSWTLNSPEFLAAIAMEKAMLFLLMFIITIVASFSIGSTLFNHVVRRTREIGLLSALGSSPVQILKLFLSQGFFIGVAGYALGVVFTFLIMTFRQEIISVMGAGDMLFKQYMFGKVPLYYNAGDFGKAAVLTIILMTVASLLPAIWAARRKPSEAMRDVI